MTEESNDKNILSVPRGNVPFHCVCRHFKYIYIIWNNREKTTPSN